MNNLGHKQISKSANKLPASNKSLSNRQYNSYDSNKWWSVGESMNPGITPQSIGLSLNNNSAGFRSSEPIWDVSDSLEDLYHRVNNQSKFASSSFRQNNDAAKVDTRSWFAADNSHGFIRVFPSETTSYRESQLIPCNVTTTAECICVQRGMPENSLHVQMNGGTIRRLEAFDCPLAIQNDYLTKIGYCDVRRIQEMGPTDELSYLVRFHAGKPFYDGTYSKNELTAHLLIRRGKFIHQWVRRLCTLCGTRMCIYKEKAGAGKALEVQLAKGSVEEVKVKGQLYTLKLTSFVQGERSVYLAFDEEPEYFRWLKKAKKATCKLPTRADLSNCHLEIMPDTIFINDGLLSLNLRHNALKERPLDEDIYTVGWLDDLPRFFKLSSLNLSDNDLKQFPHALCHMTSLCDLNLSGNKIDEIPSGISQLLNLKVFYLHNNHLTYLPETIAHMRRLSLLVLSFNHFTSIPQCLLSPKNQSGVITSVNSLIMAGNFIETIAPATLYHMRHLRKIDLRMNHVCLLPREMVKLGGLDLVTHLDLRDNRVSNLDIRGMKKLETLLCERCGIKSLQLSGMSLKALSASFNQLEEFRVVPKPEWIVSLNLSHNRLKKLPDWLNSCVFLVSLNVGHNTLGNLPEGLLGGCVKLKVLQSDHNLIDTLGEVASSVNIEELYIQHNYLVSLPSNFLIQANKLRVLNVSHNQLTSFPPINDNETLNKIQELYLTANQITSDSMPRICGYTRLRVLHLAYNCLRDICDDDMAKLESLQELSVSGNNLTQLPSCLTHHPKLSVLRANSNTIRHLPDFSHADTLKVVEVSSNHLTSMSMSSLVASQINLLDVSDNPRLQVDKHDLDGIRERKRILSVDMTGKDRIFQDLMCHKTPLQHPTQQQSQQPTTQQQSQQPPTQQQSQQPPTQQQSQQLPTQQQSQQPPTQQQSQQPPTQQQSQQPLTKQHSQQPPTQQQSPQADQLPPSPMITQLWTAGFTQTSGIRNKLSVSVLSKVMYTSNDDALFCVFDGGHNDEIVKILHSILPAIMKEELNHLRTKRDYMKYTVLSAHQKLRLTGQKLGASLAICHVSRQPNSLNYDLNVANVGDVEVVLCRRGNSHVLSRSFLVSQNGEDCQRVLKSDGVITEDGRVNGISTKTRLIGSLFLYPHIVPEPHVTSTSLHRDDEFVIIASAGLWAFLGQQEAVDEIRGILQPVVAAKKLQDLAQAYGSRENIAVLVVRFDIGLSEGGGEVGKGSVGKKAGGVDVLEEEGRVGVVGHQGRQISFDSDDDRGEESLVALSDDGRILECSNPSVGRRSEFGTSRGSVMENHAVRNGGLNSGVKDENCETTSHAEEDNGTDIGMTSFSSLNEIRKMSENVASSYSSCASILTTSSDFEPMKVIQCDAGVNRITAKQGEQRSNDGGIDNEYVNLGGLLNDLNKRVSGTKSIHERRNPVTNNNGSNEVGETCDYDYRNNHVYDNIAETPCDVLIGSRRSEDDSLNLIASRQDTLNNELDFSNNDYNYKLSQTGRELSTNERNGADALTMAPLLSDHPVHTRPGCTELTALSFPQYPDVSAVFPPQSSFVPHAAPFVIEADESGETGAEEAGSVSPMMLRYIDRDAILFHKMQQMMMVTPGISVGSVKSVPGDREHALAVFPGRPFTSHSIEVIVQSDDPCHV